MVRGEWNFTQTYCLWFLRTSLNTLFSLSTVYLFTPQAPAAPRPLWATDGPLCCPAKAAADLLHPPGSSRHNPVPLLTCTCDITACIRNKTFSCMFRIIAPHGNMHSRLDWLKQEENESPREALFKRFCIGWWLKGCQVFRKKKPEQTPILSARKIWKHKHCNVRVHRGLGRGLLSLTGSTPG